MQHRVAPVGAEEVEGDPAAPQVEVGHAPAGELGARRRRGHEGAVGAAVDPRHPAVEQGVGGHTVVAGEAADVGLVDRDRRQVEAPGRAQADGAERDGRGEVDDVGPEVGQHPADLDVGQPDREGGVARQPHRAGAVDGDALVVGAAGAGSDHERLVAGADEVADDVTHRVGDAVDLRQERLGDDRYSHAPDGRAVR